MCLGRGLTNPACHVRKKSRASFLFSQLQVYFAKRYTRRSTDSSLICAVGGKTENAFSCFRQYHANTFEGKQYTVYIS